MKGAAIRTVLGFLTLLSGVCFGIDLTRLPATHAYNLALFLLTVIGLFSFVLSPKTALIFYVFLVQPCVVLILNKEAQMHPGQEWGALTAVPLVGTIVMYLSYDRLATLVYAGWAIATISFLGLFVYSAPGGTLILGALVCVLCFIVLVMQDRHDIEIKTRRIAERVQDIERQQSGGS